MKPSAGYIDSVVAENESLATAHGAVPGGVEEGGGRRNRRAAVRTRPLQIVATVGDRPVAGSTCRTGDDAVGESHGAICVHEVRADPSRVRTHRAVGERQCRVVAE